MCLITKNKQKYIATEDMVVYKTLREIDENRICSEHMNFTYTLNKLYIEEMLPSDDICFYDSWASMKYNTATSKATDDVQSNVAICIGQGFHFMTEYKRAFNDALYSDIDVYKCIIPKGSEYYLDNSDLGVSNQIIIKGKYAK